MRFWYYHKPAKNKYLASFSFGSLSSLCSLHNLTDFNALNCPNQIKRLADPKKKERSNPLSGQVELFLKVALEYEVSQTAENNDCESCHTKYSDILDNQLSGSHKELAIKSRR